MQEILKQIAALNAEKKKIQLAASGKIAKINSEIYRLTSANRAKMRDYKLNYRIHRLNSILKLKSEGNSFAEIGKLFNVGAYRAYELHQLAERVQREHPGALDPKK